jgi:hypothetical protein
MAKRFKQIAETHDWIEQIDVLYFGDSDDKGNEIRMNIVNAMEWYSGQRDDLPQHDDIVKIPVPVEVRHVAITSEQVEHMGLTGYQLEALTNTIEFKIYTHYHVWPMYAYTIVRAVSQMLITVHCY